MIKDGVDEIGSPPKHAFAAPGSVTLPPPGLLVFSSRGLFASPDSAVIAY